ncbi:hypothetical protein J155_01656 [Xanthomonas citri pv. citri]|nr:hypothetical protein J151_01658 [Xanthomonas citri subsp. citri A306]AJY81636.1 hypothetical protein J159_01654 [Xanthomonas citri pv. citri]AJY86058.1 hypothetical protein J158_01654 [Xanthomonas citri subsp. citri UI6]AJY90482.1 hypothetical protein J169_01654 [Xanthomonas citri pv. citri]AJY94953.1 hypothetical protein J164_01654 [Xanthomonas citri pv. citri]
MKILSIGHRLEACGILLSLNQKFPRVSVLSNTKHLCVLRMPRKLDVGRRDFSFKRGSFSQSRIKNFY